MGTKVTWIVVTDGGRARIAVSESPGTALRVAPKFHKELDSEVPAGRDIVSDKPGRAFDSAGAGRHAMVPSSDPRDVAKHNFIREVAQYLDQADKAGKFHRLILVAPPRSLGELRSELPARVQSKVANEVNKDLTHLSPDALGEHIATMLDLPRG